MKLIDPDRYRDQKTVILESEYSITIFLCYFIFYFTIVFIGPGYFRGVGWQL